MGWCLAVLLSRRCHSGHKASVICHPRTVKWRPLESHVSGEVHYVRAPKGWELKWVLNIDSGCISSPALKRSVSGQDFSCMSGWFYSLGITALMHLSGLLPLWLGSSQFYHLRLYCKFLSSSCNSCHSPQVRLYSLCVHSTTGRLRDVHGFIEKRRGRKGTEVARRIKGGNKNERDRSSQ